MRSIIALVGVVLTASMLSGCNTTHVADAKYERKVDNEYVAAVETAARNNSLGIEVIWINPPTKKVAMQTQDNE